VVLMAVKHLKRWFDAVCTILVLAGSKADTGGEWIS
jgi:hypothetical protein